MAKSFRRRRPPALRRESPLVRPALAADADLYQLAGGWYDPFNGRFAQDTGGANPYALSKFAPNRDRVSLPTTGYVDGGWSGFIIEAGHTALDFGGMIPLFGAVFDLANAGIYAYEGRRWEAAFSLGAALPGIGDFATAGKYGTKLFRSVDVGVNLAQSAYYGVQGYQNGSALQVGLSLVGAGMNVRAAGDLLQNAGQSAGTLMAGEHLRVMKAQRLAEANAETLYVQFNKTHSSSLPIPKGTGPNGGRLQSHHGLQQQWAKENLANFEYDPDLAPTITIETGLGHPHTAISAAQNARRNARVAAGRSKWSSSLQDELQYIVDDFTLAGYSRGTITNVLNQQYKMFDKLGVPYSKIDY